MAILQKIRKTLLEIEQRVPFIPDFSDFNNLGKIFLVTFWLIVIYSFTQINNTSEFYGQFWSNIKEFTPYLVVDLIMFTLFSKIIKSITPFFAILLILILNFIAVYITHSLLFLSLNHFFEYFSNSILDIYVSLGMIFFFLIYFDWREKNLDPANNLAKLIFLQSKMRPHFLFNTLNSIVALIKKEPATAKKMLLNLSDLLRVSIKEEDIAQLYELKNEISLCKKYLEIEQIRLGERLSTEFNIEEGLEKAQVPRLFIQPLIENAVLHGIQNLEKGTITVKISKNLINNIVIEIKNPINTENPESKTASKGNRIALNNIKERLKIYYQSNVEFKTIQKDGYYYVLIEIPHISQ